jgi:hypothetical protein
MNVFANILNQLVNSAIDCAGFVIDSLSLLLTGGTTGLILAPTIGIVPGNLSEGDLAAARRWHGSIDDQYTNIDNLVNLLTKKKNAWDVPEPLLADITGSRDILQKLIPACRGDMATRADRNRRNAVLKAAVGLCLLEIKIWVYGQYTAGVVLADEVHDLGFLLPGETGGRHALAEATNVIAEVKVKVISADMIRVVVDQSSGKDAGPVLHGWPQGVRHVLIVINADDGKTEVVRQLTTRLHNDIRMPDGSHGKQFIIKASFMRHVDDEPRFGDSPTFSMPLTTDDLAAHIDHQHHDDYEARMREIEAHRQAIERLQAELAAKK